ncbi:MAG: glucoamylase family protein, partial [Candidatus Pacebacteria bacterium]|nr:glucoamylase family protein [Candidatus Paceibacterota bacterium]
MIKYYQNLRKKAENIAKKDIIFLFPKKNKKLIKKILKKGSNINKDYYLLAEKTKKTNYICPEAEWIFDHFYLIQQKWTELRSDFDIKNFLLLPQIGSGPLKGYPRVYNLIVQLLAHSNNKVGSKELINFLNGYQRQNHLSLAELSFLPQIITLELILNFQNKIKETIEKINQTDKANKVFKNLFAKNQGDIRQFIDSLAKETNTQEIYYIEALWQKLEGDKIYHRLVKKWLQSYLKSQGTNIITILHETRKKTLFSEEFFANTIDTLKWLPNTDWPDLIEKISIVERILRQDPAKAYYWMDEKGKALYQKKVQNIARKFKIKEAIIAKNIIALANSNTEPKNHVGYFLFKKGYQDLERAFQYQRTFLDKLKNFIIKTKSFWYFGCISFFTLLSLFLVIPFLPNLNSFPGIFSLIIAFFLGTEISIVLVNHLSSKIIPPNVPFRLYYKRLPKDYKTLIVMNSLLDTKKRIDSVIDNLKINYLNSQDQNIFYGLAFDFKDSEQEKELNDKKILKYAQERIDELNKKYSYRFFLFCRKRTWNPIEKLFMGWERKRGKLLELNKFLLGYQNTSFIIPKNIPLFLKNIKYIITLDEDNIIPKESAKLLIGSLAHPLNRPVINNNQVISGYSVIQPHISIRLKDAQKSLFAKIFSLPTVIDPHTHALSNVYQDIFESGSYVGKGIYDLAVFSKVLENKIPENMVLSHDLLEGSMAKTGLASDIVFFESFPSQFTTYFCRLHRWIRGDWQIINWLFPKTKNALGKNEKNTLSFLDKWKIFDNLRRNILSIVFIFGFLISLQIRSLPLFIYTSLVFALPLILPILSYIFKRHKHIPFSNLYLRLKQVILTALAQVFLRLTFLIFYAYTELSAFLHFLIKKCFLKKKFLEWQTYQELVFKIKGTFLETLYIMIIPFSLSFVFLVFVLINKNIFFYPLSFLWFFSPLFGFLISQPISFDPKINIRETTLLRNWAARSWAYYQTFVNKETNFLPPDNVQTNKVYYYTSPTNIGAYFLAMSSAYTLGYLTSSELVNKTTECLKTVKSLKKEKGHLFNWYDVRTIEPVEQKYISSVDSGNFVASLFVLKACLQNINNFSLEKLKQGLKDYLLIIREIALKNIQNKENQKLCQEINKYLKEQSIVKLSTISLVLTDFQGKTRDKELLFWLNFTRERAEVFAKKSIFNQELVKNNLKDIEEIINNTNFQFLYNKERNLFQIGYNLKTNKKDIACYDLFGSEANITSFISIALGQTEPIHWKKLNRTLISSNKKLVLLSWGGSLFEHINNLIFFPIKPNSLLQENGKEVIRAHIKYARKLKIPWGMSEAAHFATETSDEIHYRIFGLPNIGVKRDLGQYKIVSPYSSFISLCLFPQKTIKNLLRLKKKGAFGQFGFYDSMDFNSKRITPAYYSHHLGFSLASICNFLEKREIQKLFSDNSIIAASEYLL